MAPPVRIQFDVPFGWVILYHEWRAVSPEDLGADRWLTEDLFQAENKALRLLLDVGWYSDGQFRAVVMQPDFRGSMMAEFRSTDVTAVIGQCRKWLENPPIGEIT